MDINMQSPMPAPEHDDEGKMAKADLYKTAKYSLKLFKMMEDDAQLEGWVQAKITKAADYLASVYHYLEYEMKFTDYGRSIEDSEMYSESEKKILRNKLFEAKEKVKALKKAQAEKLKAKDKKKVNENQADIDDIHADIRGRGDNPTRKIPGTEIDSPFDEFETGKGRRRITRRSDSPASGNDAVSTSTQTSTDRRADQAGRLHAMSSDHGASKGHVTRVSAGDRLAARQAEIAQAEEDFDDFSYYAKHDYQGAENTIKDLMRGGDDWQPIAKRILAYVKGNPDAEYSHEVEDALHDLKMALDQSITEAKKSKKAKKDYDGDGNIESGKDEVIGSRRKAAGLPFKESRKLSEIGDTPRGRAKLKGIQQKMYNRFTDNPDSEDGQRHGRGAANLSNRLSGLHNYDPDEGPYGTPPTNLDPDYPDYDAIEKGVREGSKPDFLDMDKDGNKKEPMKRAAANKKVREAADKKCNHSPKGKSCPVHGMKECSGMAESKPSAGMSKGEKSAVAKKAQAGKDIGKPGKSFDKVAKAAGGGEKGKKIAAAAMWKNQAK